MHWLLSYISRLPIAKKIVMATGLALFGGLLLFAITSIWYQQTYLVHTLTMNGVRLGDTIRVAVRNAMMLNARPELAETVKDIQGQKDISAIRIYSQEGEVMFSGSVAEVGTKATKQDEVCAGCHGVLPPREQLSVAERTRMFTDENGRHMLGVLTPITNEPSCSDAACHFHPADRKVLGALDVVFPLAAGEEKMLNFYFFSTALAIGILFAGGLGVHVYLQHFLTKPIAKLIEGTRAVARQELPNLSSIRQEDEIGELATAISQMAHRIAASQEEINHQRDEYQTLFDQVPCSITVQGKDFRLQRYNKQFREMFSPEPGDFCYKAYKGRTEKCLDCSVEKTMQTGLPHCSEESITTADGTKIHWIVHTSPVLNAQGEAIAVMEMGLDITARRQLEEQLRRSELKYLAIFNNIPSSVFVLCKDTLKILECNITAITQYGWSREDLLNKSFLDFFLPEERVRYDSLLKSFTVINHARHYNRLGKSFYVDILLSVSENLDEKALLVITNDITERLEAEQKVVQAGKMATLGEMATGVAHELNQPLTVIKSASSFMLRKVNKQEPIAPEILGSLAKEIDSHVDRASKIIIHMRNFGRRTDHELEQVQVNDILRDASEFFVRQFAQRSIHFVWQLSENLPPIMATPNLLEQVFTNLLINARDAIEERAEKEPQAPKRITVRTFMEEPMVIVQVQDTGTGLPLAVLQRLFEPFFTTKSVGKGTGLGLSISYGLVKDFGGTILAGNKVADHEDGIGAIFTLRFPSAGGGNA